MREVCLCQAENLSINISLSEDLQENENLVYSISNSIKVVLSGSLFGGEVREVDRRHFVVELAFEDTYGLSSCDFELALVRGDKSVVNIGDEPIRLLFRRNKIKEVI